MAAARCVLLLACVLGTRLFGFAAADEERSQPSWALFKGYVGGAKESSAIEEVIVSSKGLAASEPHSFDAAEGSKVSSAPSRLVRRATKRRIVGIDAEAALVDVDGSGNGTEQKTDKEEAHADLKESATSAAAALNQSKLFIIMTGERSIGAIKARYSWIEHVKWPDKVLFACGHHCREDPRLDSVVLVPDLLRAKKYTQKWDYRQAAMRAPWVMQWVWKNINRTGTRSRGVDVNAPDAIPAESALENEGYGMRLATKPFKWWIIGDDDTFFNLPVLDDMLRKYDTEKPICMAQGKRTGGPGIVLTKAAVEKFVPTFWTSYLPRWRDVTHDIWGDAPLIDAMRDLGSDIVDPEEFTQEPPTIEALQKGTYAKTYATWHHAWQDRQPEDYERYLFGANGTANH